jgi:putative ATP-dependent endonuclease of OLD family
MHLAELTITGFRKLASLKVSFRPGLNVLVGSNNVGKTAVIDALRALLSTAEDGSLKLSDYDLHTTSDGHRAQQITFHYVFRGLGLDEEADFLAALKPRGSAIGGETEYEAHISVRYAATDSAGRLRPKRWCGDHEENAVATEMLEDLRAVYLPALRDPAYGLRPNRSSQVARLIDRLSSAAEKEKLVESLLAFDVTLKAEQPVATTQAAIKSRHVDMLGETLTQALSLGLTPPDFQRLAARLALTVDNLDIEQNGLGYNNLIYMAVVLSELSLNPDCTYKALLIEEPEAHLHPQMQAVLLDYLQSAENAKANKNLPESQQAQAREKPVQIFVTSHSPNFASIAHLDSIGCIHDGASGIKAFAPRDVKFGPGKKEKLQRYLDVTRAELYFAPRIILVEGTAERFLVNTLATRCGVDLRKKSVSVLSTDGLNFDAFAPLFGDTAMNVRVAIVSDGDPSDPAPLFPSLTDQLSLSDTAKSIQALSNGCIKTCFARKTLEYDLALHPENISAMLSALKDIHPSIGNELEKELGGVGPAEKAKTLFNGMFDRGPSRKNVQKGAYAQSLAQIVAKVETEFVVPQYIKDAIDFVIKD